MSLDSFREETRDWLQSNCPEAMRLGAVHFEDAYEIYQTKEAQAWHEAAAVRGWTAPTWPKRTRGP